MALTSLRGSLLLALAVFVVTAASPPSDYQALLLSSLGNPVPLLLSEELTLSTTTTTTTSLSIPLAARDWLVFASKNSTAEDIFLLRLARDADRVASISPVQQPPPQRHNATASHRGPFHGPVVSGLSQGSGEYFTRIGVGTPASPVYMVLDTGSDVIWLQCAPCRRCYQQADPIFDPRRSRSFAAVPCDAPVCRRLDSAGCDLRRQACLYEVSYGDGSVTAGEFGTETLTFSGGARVGRIALGCGHDNEGLFVAAAGLLGLGRGRLSFPTQIARRFGRRFSYCLVDRTTATSSASRRLSSLTFGGTFPTGAYTPMVKNPRMETFYYVELTGISVGGSRVRGVLESDLKLDPMSGRGGVIVDSGTSVTRLARAAYEAMRDAFKAGAVELESAAGGTTAGGFSLFDTCYDLGGKTVVRVPTVVMHFAGGADVALPAENYLIPVDTKGTFCFAFAATDGGVSIIGNIQQQGYQVVFDAESERVGFVPRGC